MPEPGQHLAINLSQFMPRKEGQNLLMSSALLMVILSLEQNNRNNNDTSCPLSGEHAAAFVMPDKGIYLYFLFAACVIRGQRSE